MLLIKEKPTTSSRRHLIKLNQKSLNLSKSPFIKSKVKGIKKNSSGRNNSGKITVFHKGGGVKKKYRMIDFYRVENSTGIVCSLEHDPNRNCYIAAIYDFNNRNFSYIIAPKYLKVGNIVKSGLDIEPNLGSSLPILNIPLGTSIHNISINPNVGGQISRAAGTSSILKEKSEKYATIELSSGQVKKVSTRCVASIGEVSKELFFLTRLGKAGQSRWLNKRPTVRGVAMNPIDHPHGGGEGKKSGFGRNPWGKSSKGSKTSNSRFSSIF